LKSLLCQRLDFPTLVLPFKQTLFEALDDGDLTVEARIELGAPTLLRFPC
jgi:hypothetical protein